MQRLHEFCTVEGCGRKHKARGYCPTHYMMFKRCGKVVAEIKTRIRDKPECCQEEGCSEPVKSKGMCATHYQRYLRHGHTRYRDRKRPPKFCRIAECDDYLYANGLCHLHYMKHRNWKDFDFSVDDFQEMLKRQNHACKICGKPERAKTMLSGKPFSMSIDHCHKTGKIRGLLCSACNRALGLFRDDANVLKSAIKYLELAQGHSEEPKSSG